MLSTSCIVLDVGMKDIDACGKVYGYPQAVWIAGF